EPRTVSAPSMTRHPRTSKVRSPLATNGSWAARATASCSVDARSTVRPAPEARPRPEGSRAGGDDMTSGPHPEHPFQVSVEGGLDVRGRDPLARGPPDDPELRAEQRRAFHRHRPPPRHLRQTVCTLAP